MPYSMTHRARKKYEVFQKQCKGTITYDINYFIKRFRSRVLQPVKVIATKEIVYTSLTGLVWNTSISAIVLGQYGYPDVICTLYTDSKQTTKQFRLQIIGQFVHYHLWTQPLKNARNG